LINSLTLISGGKAAGFDLLTAEHLKFSHPVVILSLKVLFSLMMSVDYVPDAFGCGITVPLPKAFAKGAANKSDYYRGISIRHIISKLLELTLQKCLEPFLKSSTAQFGLKKNNSCTQAVFCVRKIIDNFTRNGSTVNICSLDISKAFDNVSHVKLFNKLIDKNVPVKLILILISWYSKMEICVKWGNVYSHTVRLVAGVRQG